MAIVACGVKKSGITLNLFLHVDELPMLVVELVLQEG
jgi:hypothetical protein